MYIHIHKEPYKDDAQLLSQSTGASTPLAEQDPNTEHRNVCAVTAKCVAHLSFAQSPCFQYDASCLQLAHLLEDVFVFFVLAWWLLV